MEDGVDTVGSAGDGVGDVRACCGARSGSAGAGCSAKRRQRLSTARVKLPMRPMGAP